MDRRAVDRQHRGDAEIVEHLEHAPETDPVAVFVPGPIRDVGHRRAAGRRGQDSTRHRLVDVPFLDIDDDPDREPRPVGERERFALGDRGIIQPFGGEHRRNPLSLLNLEAYSTSSTGVDAGTGNVRYGIVLINLLFTCRTRIRPGPTGGRHWPSRQASQQSGRRFRYWRCLLWRKAQALIGNIARTPTGIWSAIRSQGRPARLAIGRTSSGRTAARHGPRDRRASINTAQATITSFRGISAAITPCTASAGSGANKQSTTG